MRRSPRTRLLAASVAMFFTFVLAACGDDDDDDTTGTTVTDVTDVTDVTSSSTATDTEPPDDTDVSAPEPADTAADDTAGPDDTTPTSGSGEVGTQDEYIEAARAEVDFEDEAITDCVSAAIVGDEIYAAIQETGLSIDDFKEDGPAGLGLDETVATQVAADFAACGELIPQVLEGDDEIACAEENLTNEQMASFLAFGLLGLELGDDVTAANDAVEACLAARTPTTTA